MLESLIPYAAALGLSLFLGLLFGAFRWRYLRYVRRTIYSSQSPELYELDESRTRRGGPPLDIAWVDAAQEATAPVPLRLVDARQDTRRMHRALAVAGFGYVLVAVAVVWYGAIAAHFSVKAALWLGYTSSLVGVFLIVAFVGSGWRRWPAAGAGWLALAGVLLVLGLRVKPSTAVTVIANGIEYASLPLAVVAPLTFRMNRPLIVGFVPMIGLYLVCSATIEFLLQLFNLSFAGHVTLPFLVAGAVTAVAGIGIAVWQIRRGVRRRFVLLLAAMLAVGFFSLIRRPDSRFNIVVATIGGLGFNGLLTLTTWTLFSQFLNVTARGRLTDEILHFSFCWLVLTALLPLMAQMGWNAVPLALLTFSVYATSLLLLLRDLERRWVPRPPARMLLLRVFDQEPVRNQLLDVLDDSWRRVGRLDLIVGADLALRSLGARALEAFLLGRVRGRVLKSVQEADRSIASLAKIRTIDGRFPLNELHCSPEVWPYVVSTLATGADVVLMDLRGWRASHRAATFELALVLEHVPLRRVVMLTDRHTDEPLLASAVARTWSELTETSVNAPLSQPCLGVVRCSGRRRIDALAIAHRVFVAADGEADGRAIVAPPGPRQRGLAADAVEVRR